MAVFEHAPNRGNGADKTSLLLNQTALHFVSRAAYGKAEPLYRRALAIGEASLGPDHPTVAIRLNNLGPLLEDTNRAAEAEPLFRRAWQIFHNSLEPDHPRTKTVRNNLSALTTATIDQMAAAAAVPRAGLTRADPPRTGKRGFFGGLFRRA